MSTTIKFTEDANTMSYGEVKAGDIKIVSKPDGKAFINQGIAKKTKKEVK